MKTKVYIDGQSGTTGLQIYDRIGQREDLELLRIPEDKRHDPVERKKYLNAADIVFLCLPDEGAKEAVSMIESDHVKVIDASTAHRTNDNWTYGFPELSREQREEIRRTKRLANPGCHATGFISLTAPLVRMGILPKEYPLTCYSLTGYTGGGKKMIGEYEDAQRDRHLSSPGIYGLTLHHKHIPEMQKVTGITYAPAFIPVVDDYAQGMAGSVLLHNRLLNRVSHASEIAVALREYYKDQNFVIVHDYEENPGTLYANSYMGTNELHIVVSGHEHETCLTALFDNLGKGASGAAVQNMNLMLGLDETLGLL